MFSPVDGGLPLPEISGLLLHVRADLGITKDESDFVSQWDDQSASGANLTEATNKPLWVDALVNGHPAVRFDGTNDIMTSGAFASTSKPAHIFAVFNSVSWVNYDRIYSSISSGEKLTLEQTGSTPQIQQVAGSARVNALSATLGTFFLVNSFFNAGASYQGLNDDSNVGTANPGTQGAFTSISLAARAGDGSPWGNVEFAEFCLYNVEITGDDLTSLKDYFNSRYALWT